MRENGRRQRRLFIYIFRRLLRPLVDEEKEGRGGKNKDLLHFFFGLLLPFSNAYDLFLRSIFGDRMVVVLSLCGFFFFSRLRRCCLWMLSTQNPPLVPRKKRGGGKRKKKRNKEMGISF